MAEYMVVVGIFFLLYMVWRSVVQLRLVAEYSEQWNICLWLKAWHIERKIFDSDQSEAQDASKQAEQRTRDGIRAMPLDWQQMITLLRQAVPFVLERVELQTLQLYSHIGWSRADITAYSYGLFWSIVSLLPSKWFEKSEIQYIPDFQHNQQYVKLDGIITCKVGQIITIVLHMCRLMAKLLLEQRNRYEGRKEQVIYEN